jgi:uncharacterized Rmd1/YagE family protein
MNGIRRFSTLSVKSILHSNQHGGPGSSPKFYSLLSQQTVLQLTWRGKSSSPWGLSSARLISSSGPKVPTNLKSSQSNPLLQTRLSALRFKARSGKKKAAPGKDEWSVVGYSAANSFDMFGLQEGLQRQLIYTEMNLVEELYGNCLYVTNKYQSDSEDQNKEIFFFKDGNVVFWNIPELERNSVLKFLTIYSLEGYDEDLIYEESELMTFAPTQSENAYLEKGRMYLNPGSPSYILAKYTFSDAIAASVKLGAWEASLETIIDSIEHISEDLKRNANVKLTRDEVLQKTGEILALRHVINLSSDLLDTPDFYWDREGLENLYMSTCSHLAVAKRTKIVNEKLSHCLELMELITTHLSDEHGSRLEWIIIVLIAIEIGFEVLHLVERKYGGLSVLGSHSDE